MKKFSVLSAFLVLFTAIGFISCESEPVDPLLIDNQPQPTGPAVFKVDFSGSTYTAEQTQALVTGSSIMITGLKASNGSSFVLTVPGTTTGTYNGGDAQFPLMAYHPTLTSAFMYANVDPSLEVENPTGSITITSINTTAKTISGTFNFTGYWTDEAANQPNISFTNGSFQNIPYTGSIGPEPEVLFQVTKAGQLFTADEAQATIGSGLTTIAGMRGTNGEYIAIVIDATTEGTYTEEAIMTYYESETDENGYSNFLGSPGTVTISEIDEVNHTISGTFSFTGVNDSDEEMVFTNGVFENVPYTTENTSTDLLSATVDGAAVNYDNSVIVTWVESGADANIGIQGFGDDHEIRLSIGNDLSVGTYAILGVTMGDAHGFYTDADDVDYTATEGTLTITSKANGRIAGTFEYFIKDGSGNIIHTISNGEFDVEYDF